MLNLQIIKKPALPVYKTSFYIKSTGYQLAKENNEQCDNRCDQEHRSNDDCHLYIFILNCRVKLFHSQKF